MTVVSNILRQFARYVRNAAVALPKPVRIVDVYGVRWPRAIAASAASAAVFMFAYYVSLGWLPQLAPSGSTPSSYFHSRFDLADFVGSLVWPPTLTRLTWPIGFGTLGLLLAAGGMTYGVLLSWFVTSSSVKRGLGFGAAAFLVTGFVLWLANGFDPAIMRAELPDTGIFLIGWSPFAAVQLCSCFLIYGASVGWIYGKPRIGR